MPLQWTYLPSTSLLFLCHSTFKLFPTFLPLQREDSIYTSTQFGIEDKPVIPRLPGEEGLYVPPQSMIEPHNLYKLDARLLREDPRTRIFYDDDGNLKVRSIET